MVLWSHNPLSIYAKVEKTIIEGKVYFDREEDQRKRANIKKEKAKLINMMLQEKLGGGKTRVPMKRQDRDFECDTMEELKN